MDTSPLPAPPRRPTPTPPTERAVGPDLARGVMLALIALANSHYFLRSDRVLGGYPRGPHGVDAGITWFVASFVDARSFPLFAVLFGYGVARIAARAEALGPRGVRQLLRRRAGVLVAVGFLHAVLLFVGDVLTAYGVLLLLGVWAIRWRDRRLLVVAIVVFVVVNLPGGPGSLSTSSDPPDPTMLPPDLVTMFAQRPWVSLVVALVGPLGFGAPFLVGLWAGRHRVLEAPQHHPALLRGAAVVGIGVGVLGAQPVALRLAGVLPVPDVDTFERLGALHDATGMLAGVGYAAFFALLAQRLLAAGRPRGRVVGALVATGRRSMTCYLLQSVVWAVVFTPFLLDLSGTLTVTTTALLALATWTATVVLADRLARSGRRGPFEALVRRVTYGPAGA